MGLLRSGLAPYKMEGTEGLIWFSKQGPKPGASQNCKPSTRLPSWPRVLLQHACILALQAMQRHH